MLNTVSILKNAPTLLLLLFVCVSTNLSFGANKNIIDSAVASVENADLTIEEKAIEKELIEISFKEI
ncbi:hypothetical protein [Methanosarcina sp.]|uniref:hypothetical protein n=1 Tax=Methanosarcina sp. TaxID=2213 RepID=UPI003C787CE5